MILIQNNEKRLFNLYKQHFLKLKLYYNFTSTKAYFFTNFFMKLTINLYHLWKSKLEI